MLRWLKLCVRWALYMPSPSQLVAGPSHYDAATRRYVRLRRAGKIGPAYWDADFWTGPHS